MSNPFLSRSSRHKPTPISPKKKPLFLFLLARAPLAKNAPLVGTRPRRVRPPQGGGTVAGGDRGEYGLPRTSLGRCFKSFFCHVADPDFQIAETFEFIHLETAKGNTICLRCFSRV